MHRVGQRHVGVGVETPVDLGSLVPQVGLHLVELLVASFAAEALVEAVPAAVGADGHHASRRQALLRRRVVTVIPVVPVRIRRDSSTLGLAHADTPG